MQRHTLLLNYSFSSTTLPTQSSFSGDGQSFLVNDGSYYINNVAGLNLGVVNPTNVRAYLNDSANTNVINDFFSYLTGNTNQDQFREIFYSDQKLSNVFNSYYSQTITKSQQTSVYHINKELTGTTNESYLYSNYNWNGQANLKYPFTGITQEINNSTKFVTQVDYINTFTTDESYYIPVFIKSNYKEINTMTYNYDSMLIRLGISQDPYLPSTDNGTIENLHDTVDFINNNLGSIIES